MREKISSFPGKQCRHYAKGRCMLDEERNPGLHREHICKELLRLEGHFDGLLKRLEGFHLTDPQSMKIMESLMDRQERGSGCQERIRLLSGSGSDNEPGDGIDCVHAQGHVCLLIMPVCNGVCRYYSPLGQITERKGEK